jgi:hypothetical protein
VGTVTRTAHAQRLAVFEANIRGALAAIAKSPRKQDMVGVPWRNALISPTAAKYLPWDVYGRGNQLPVQDLRP